jgi:hypothetical protein
MYTNIETKSGEKISFLTQQYQVGLYCIINGDSSKQFGIDAKDADFHAEVRKKALKNGDTLLSGSYIEQKRKSKFDINKFKE